MSTATNEIVENKMVPVTKQEPVVMHHVTVDGLVQMASFEPGIDKEFQLLVAKGMADGMDWMVKICELAVERVSKPCRNMAKSLGFTSFQKEKNHERIKPLYDKYMQQNNRLSRFRVILSAATRSAEFAELMGITVNPDGTIAAEIQKPSFSSIDSAWKQGKEILATLQIKWDGTPIKDKQEESTVKVQNKVAEEMGISAGAILAMTDEQREALRKQVDDKVKADAAAAMLARRVKQIDAWTADILKFAGSKDDALKFLEEIRAKIEAPEPTTAPF